MFSKQKQKKVARRNLETARLFREKQTVDALEKIARESVRIRLEIAAVRREMERRRIKSSIQLGGDTSGFAEGMARAAAATVELDRALNELDGER